MLNDEIYIISWQPTSAPMAPTPSIVPDQVSYSYDVSHGDAGGVLNAVADSRRRARAWNSFFLGEVLLRTRSAPGCS